MSSLEIGIIFATRCRAELRELTLRLFNPPITASVLPTDKFEHNDI